MIHKEKVFTEVLGKKVISRNLINFHHRHFMISSFVSLSRVFNPNYFI